MNYRSYTEKLIPSERMERVHADVQIRLKNRDDREGTNTAEMGTDGKNPFLDVFMERPNDSYVICLAHAIVRSWMVTPMLIHHDEAVVGTTRPMYPYMEHFFWGIEQNADDPFIDKTMDMDEMQRMAHAVEKMFPIRHGHVNREGEQLLGRELYQILMDDAMIGPGGAQGHTIPNYDTLFENGLDGMLEKIDRYAAVNVKDKEMADFYEANRVIIRGMSAYLEQYAKVAEEKAAEERDATQKRYYLEIAENCKFVAHQKPETLYQAVQLMWCLSLWDWVDCLGRVDQYLYPFYEKAVREGDVIPAEDSIVSIMFKIWEHGAHNTTLSGAKPEDGTDATNELSYVFLQILRYIHDTHPRMVVRVREDIPQDLMNLIVQIWAEGMCDPTVVSDANVIPGLLNIGVTLEDARNYATLGCQEIEIPGKSNTGCEDGKVNLAKILEYAMNGGKSSKQPAVQVGPVTKTFMECETFEDLWESYTAQVEYFTRIFCFLCDRGQEARAANHSKLVKGTFTTGCLEKGISHDAGGPIYGYGVVETAGSSAVGDSLTAIKKLVFDENKISKETLSAALKANFAGYEKERQMLLNMAPKFGNDNEEADAMTCRVLNHFWDEIAKYKSVRGGVYTGACSLLTGGIEYGRAMGAMADGRFAGEPLGNSIGPRPGADKNGVSAMLASVAKLPLGKAVGGTTLNVVLTTKLLANPGLRESIAGTVKAFMVNGGQMAQITTANMEDLLDAQAHPERHGNLIVRVGGFSTQFVLLGKEVQDEIIQRYSGEVA